MDHATDQPPNEDPKNAWSRSTLCTATLSYLAATPIWRSARGVHG